MYNLSEQGKEFLDVSASEMLVQSFQLTRDLTNRQVVAIPSDSIVSRNCLSLLGRSAHRSDLPTL